MNLVLLVIIVTFIFIVTYNPKKETKTEMYQGPPIIDGPTCDSKRYLELQGMTGDALIGACDGAPIESGGVIFYA